MTTANRKGTLYLIDGSAIIYRSYFAFLRNPLINSKGENTSAAFGFANTLIKLIHEEPDYIAVVFDTKHPTFRHERYPEYKSTRAKMPDDLVEQLPRIEEVVDALNVARFDLKGFEADDVIGTLARRAEQEGLDVRCVTGDKDFFQLVTDKVKVYSPRSGSRQGYDLLGRDEVKDKFGVYPERVIDKLALMGDSSDNVPGIPGIGTKTADKLLEQFETLEEVLDGHEEIGAKGVRKKVAENRDSALLSKELVTIATKAPVKCKLDDLRRQPVDFEKTKKLFLELEFSRLLKEVVPDSDLMDSEIDGGNDHGEIPIAYHTVTSIDNLKKLITYFGKEKEVAIDTETTSLNPLEADIVGVSLSSAAGIGYYIPLGHNHDPEENLPRDDALKLIKKLCENKKVQKFGQNIKYDLLVLRRCGIEVDPVAFDTMLASYVIDPSSRQHSLDLLALKHFNHQMQPISELIGSGKSQKTFDIVPVDKATHYAAEDADFTYRLRGVLAPLIDEHGMNKLYYNVELPLVKVLASMEEEGIRVDTDFLAELSDELEAKLVAVRKEIYDTAGGEFNINSTQQLSHILFEKLGLPTKGRTAKKTGYSTDVRVLEELAQLHDFPQLILDYRQLTKLKSTYVDAIPKLVSERTGRVHTSFNQTVAATGRLSSTDPNLQNIPVRTEVGRQIRRAFVPRDSDHKLLVADYSQIELRILAHITEDEGLVKAFRRKEDIHARTAAEVYGVDIKDVTPDQRRAAKTANFAVIYGVSAYGLAQQTELDFQGAKQFIETYFERYPGIRRYMDETKAFAKEKGYVTTLYNRRRYLPEINNRSNNVRQFAERMAINTPIQGTAAEMIKVAMIKIHDKLKSVKSRMLLQVHDELVLDVHKDEIDDVKKIVKTGMESAVKLRVPVVADMGLGDNWLDAK